MRIKNESNPLSSGAEQTTSRLSDEVLAAQVARGNSAALETLYDRHSATVLGLTLKILGDRAAAEDVLQETFWRVWKSAETFQPQRGSFRSWLFRIARNADTGDQPTFFNIVRRPGAKDIAFDSGDRNEIMFTSLRGARPTPPRWARVPDGLPRSNLQLNGRALSRRISLLQWRLLRRNDRKALMKTFRRVSISLLALVVSFIFVPVAFAHPLGNFTINHYAGLAVTKESITID